MKQNKNEKDYKNRYCMIHTDIYIVKIKKVPFSLIGVANILTMKIGKKGFFVK